MKLRFACAASLAVLLTSFLASPAHAQGMAPPPPMNPNAPGSPNAPPSASDQETRARLDEAESEDSGRNFELFWLRGDVGGGYTNLASLSSTNLALQDTTGAGPLFGLAGGVRFVILTLGAGVRYNAFSPYNLWQINGELGLKFPIGSVDLLIGGHGGYSFVGSLGDAALATNPNVPTNADKVKVRGFNAGLDLALDYYLSSLFSIGAGTFGDILFLNRPAPDLPAGFAQLPPAQQAAIKNDPLYQKSGSSTGFQVAGVLRLGLHFGL